MKPQENIQSGYMLVYERKYKNPLKTVLRESDVKFHEVVEFKEEDQISIIKEANLLTEDPLTQAYSLKETSLLSKVYQDVAKNEFYCFKPFYLKSKVIPKEYFLEVMEDNLNFQKQKTTKDKCYQKFTETAMKKIQLNLNLSNFNEPDIQEPIDMNNKLLEFTLRLNPDSENKQVILIFLAKLVNFSESSPQIAKSSISILFNQKVLIENAFKCEEEEIVRAYSNLIFCSLKCIYKMCEGKIIETHSKREYGDSLPDHLVMICDLMFSFYPKLSRNLTQFIHPMYAMFRDLLLLGDEMIEYFIAKGAITIFVTFLIGKESPYFHEYIKIENYNPLMVTFKIDNLIDLIFIIFKRSTLYAQIKNEEDLNDKRAFPISIKDINCIKNHAFIKCLFKSVDPTQYMELISLFMRDNENLTYLVCQDILALLNIVGYNESHELYKLVKILVPILSIDDELQSVRFEIIFGYPQLMVDDPNDRHKFNVFGYRKVNEASARWLEIKNPCSNSYQMSNTLIKKLYCYSNDSSCYEVYFAILQAASNNPALLQYLWNFNVEEARIDIK